MLNKDTPIRKKLMSAILLTCGAVSLLTYLAFFAYEYFTFRQSLVNQLSSLAEIIAANSTASLAFKDQESAQEILDALKARPNVVAAGLYDNDGQLFSKYPLNLSDNSYPKPEKQGYYFKEAHLVVFQPVVQNGKHHGTLYLKSDMKAMNERLTLYGLIVIIVISVTFFLAYNLSKRLQKRISDPILALAETARAISDRGDYSVRAVKMGGDEVGLLTDAFNQMVVQIEKQNTDITLFNQQLEQNREELQNIMDHSVDVICTIDEVGTFVKVSDASKLVWGYKPEELVGTNAANLLYEDDKEISIRAEQDVKNGIKITNFENRFIRKDGKIIPLTWSAKWDKKEKVMYCVARDATALKEAEYQLQKRAKELTASNEELEQFAYIASHDLQEPLRMVTSFLTQLEKKYKDQLDDKARLYIHFAVDGAIRMRKIILDLLEYSRVGRNNHDIELVDMNELVSEVVLFSRTTILEKEAKVIWQNLPQVYAARTPLQQVLQNLIGNSLKYQANGVKPVITIEGAETANSWQFSVTDNGIGIDPQFFGKIFTAFQRLHNNNEYSGTGIGLAICKKIIENHGGKIWVQSVPGKNTTFYFTISKSQRSHVNS
ncbi:MAG TPA: ATP-binding protein [Sphingobacteriaceae bacterium]